MTRQGALIGNAAGVRDTGYLQCQSMLHMAMLREAEVIKAGNHRCMVMKRAR